MNPGNSEESTHDRANGGGDASLERGDDLPIESIETWLFDLDNTLYPAECNLFSQVDWRMTFWIRDTFDLSQEDARALQKEMFRKHGTTLRGLMTEHGIDPHAFLAYVHDIDYSPVPADGGLAETIARLPGRKIIFTNGTVRHAMAVLDRLGAADLFDDVFDIVGAEFVPKPDPRPYDRLIARHAVRPETAIMVEDMAKNLLPAHERGMRTLWVEGGPAWSRPETGADHIHHRTDDLAGYLKRAVAAASS